jgi:nucleotide-binding universal stress UspA family protein
MTRILIATDFPVRSDRATRRASLLARKLGARLTLVHVVDADQPPSLITALINYWAAALLMPYRPSQGPHELGDMMLKP